MLDILHFACGVSFKYISMSLYCNKHNEIEMHLYDAQNVLLIEICVNSINNLLTGSLKLYKQFRSFGGKFLEVHFH